MKKQLITILVSLLFLNSSYVSGQSQIVAIANDDLNVLYAGLDNHITIAASETSPSKIEVTIDNGTISGSNGKYVIKPSESGRAILTVTSSGKVIGSKWFKVKRVPSPDTYWGAYTDNSVAFKASLLESGINARINNFHYDVAFDITGFELSFGTDGKNYSFTSNSSALTDDMKNAIISAGIGTKIVIKATANIKATAKSQVIGNSIKLSPITVTLN